MSNFLNEETRQRVNRLRDEFSRSNSVFEQRIRQLAADNAELRNRLSVLTRILISKQIATAEEIATALADAARPPVPPEHPAEHPPEPAT